VATPRLYLDACAIIEIARGKFAKPLTPDQNREAEVDRCNRILQAGRKGDLGVYTSFLTIAEAVHIGDVPPPPEVKDFLTRLILSGEDGVLAVEPDPFVVERARDLTWVDGIREGAMDRIHIASALHVNCTEMVTFDGRIAKRIGRDSIGSLKLVTAVNCSLLPHEYLQDDLLSGNQPENQ
jgi:predicted nucleic acid-binding protein